MLQLGKTTIRSTKNEMGGQHQNLDRTGYGEVAETGGEQTGMEECCAERVRPSDRGWIRTEQIIELLFKRALFSSILPSIYEVSLPLLYTNAASIQQEFL